MVGDGHAMGVAAQILEYMLWTTEGAFRVDHPIVSEQCSQPGGESLRLSESLQISVETQLAILEGAFEGRNKLAAKDAAEHLDGKKECVAWRIQWV